MSKQDNPYGLSAETMLKLADLLHDFTRESPQERSDKLLSFPTSEFMQEEQRLVEQAKAYCGTCVFRWGLCKNLGLTYDVQVVPLYKGATMVITVSGIQPLSITVWRQQLTLDIGALRVSYAADSVLKFQITKLFERMVEHLEHEEEKIRRAEETQPRR